MLQNNHLPHELLSPKKDTLLHRFNRRDGIVVRASALQLVDLGFIPLVESYQKT